MTQEVPPAQPLAGGEPGELASVFGEAGHVSQKQPPVGVGPPFSPHPDLDLWKPLLSSANTALPSSLHGPVPGAVVSCRCDQRKDRGLAFLFTHPLQCTCGPGGGNQPMSRGSLGHLHTHVLRFSVAGGQEHLQFLKGCWGSRAPCCRHLNPSACPPWREPL